MRSNKPGNHLKCQNSYNQLEYNEIYENFLKLKFDFEEARIKINNIIKIDFLSLEPRNRLIIQHLTHGNNYIESKFCNSTILPLANLDLYNLENIMKLSTENFNIIAQDIDIYKIMFNLANPSSRTVKECLEYLNFTFIVVTT